MVTAAHHTAGEISEEDCDEVIKLCLCDSLLVLKLEGAAVGDPDQLGVGSGAAAVEGAAPHHHQLARVLGDAAQLDAGGAGEQAVPE